MLPPLHTPTPIFMPPPSWEGASAGPCYPSARLAAGPSAPPQPPLSACWPPPFVLRRHGPRGASAKPLADAQGPGLLPGSTWAMAWKSPRLRGLSSRFPRLPGLAGMGKRCRSTARGSSKGGVGEGMDARKGGWGGERGWPESCVPGFRSGLRRVAQSIRGGVLVQNGGTTSLPEGPSRARNHRGTHTARF